MRRGGWRRGRRGFPFLFCQDTKVGAFKIMQDWLIRCCEPLVDLCGLWMLLIVLGSVAWIWSRDRKRD